ncbi:A-kinase anchor protein 11 isoform X2 [Tenrec ecaudatus]|uniref:A-kinase anchor protein 11 isoform X2 n=1 Tax=Tenrec ecaudatus TaxID=94439 RepID=UPI003F593318
MATFQTFRKSHMKTKASVRKNFSEGVFQSVKALLQSEKELCSVSAESCWKQDEHARVTEVTFLGFNEETDTAHLQDLAALSLELPDLLNSLHFCSLNENEIICMKDIKKSSEMNNGPLNQSHPSGMLCVMKVSPTLPRLRLDFIFSLLSKYATGIRYTLETYLHPRGPQESTKEDDDDTNQSVSSIEDDFVTAFEHLEGDEASPPDHDGMNLSALRSQCDAASQTASGHQLDLQGLRSLASSGQRKPSASFVNILGHAEVSSVKASVTTSVSEPWIQRSFYRSTHASDRGSETQNSFFSSSPAYSSESECSSPSPVIFLDEEGYQKSLKAKLELPKIPVTKDDIEDSDSEVSEFFDSFDQFDELEETLATSGMSMKAPAKGKLLKKKGHGHEKCLTTTMNPQKFKSDCPALPANVRKPTPRKPGSPYSNPGEAPDSPRPVPASGEDSGLFSPIRASAFSPLGGCAPTDCLCQAHAGGDRAPEHPGSVYYTYEDYANSVSCKVLDSVLRTQHTNSLANPDGGMERQGDKPATLKPGNLDRHGKSKSKSLLIKGGIQQLAADLVAKSFGSAFKDLQKGVTSCTSAVCHLAIKLTASVFQVAFDELRRQRAFSLKERAIGGLANFLVSEAFCSALKDLQYIKKQIFTNTVASFAADLAEELVFEGIMEVCQFSYRPTPAFPQCKSFDYEDKVVKSYARELSESVIQEAFIELSQVDMTLPSKAGVGFSTGHTKGVGEVSPAPSRQPSTAALTCNGPAPVVTQPAQEYRKEYTVQQALFCTSGIATSVPVPLAGSCLLPCRSSSKSYLAKAPLPAQESRLMKESHGDSTQARATSGRSEGEVACLRSICLPADSERHPINQSDFKPTQDGMEMQNAAEVASDPAIINSFSAAMVHTIVNETLESVASLRVTDDVLRTTEGQSLPVLSDRTAWQQGSASMKDEFADRLSQSIIKHSTDKGKPVIANTDQNGVSKEGWLVPGGESPLILSKFPKLLDPLDHRMLAAGKGCAPHCQDPPAHAFPLEPAVPCPAVAVPESDSKGLAKEKPTQKHSSHDPALGPMCFGQESPFPHAHTFPSPVLACADGLHVEDKQKARERNALPETPPSTPLVPSQARREWDIKKLTKKLKGELAKEFAPATPPSTPRNPAVGGFAANEQNAIEKEEFMLKLMRSLSEEVESGDGEEHAEKPEHAGKEIPFADTLATHVISLATETAASHLDSQAIEEPKAKSPDLLHLRCHTSVSPAVLNRSEENLQALWNFADDMAAEVITEAEKTAELKSCLPSRQRKKSCSTDGFGVHRGDQHGRAQEKLDLDAVAQPQEVDSLTVSLPPSTGLSGLTYKYPSCESVTDEYAGHMIQILKQEGGNSELILDQYADRLAYRSVKSGLREAVTAAQTKSIPRLLPAPGSPEQTTSELLLLLNTDHHQEVARKRLTNKKGGHFCKTLERTQDTCRKEYSELYSFSSALAHSIARDVQKELTLSTVGLPKSLTDSCLYEKLGCDEAPESGIEPGFPKPLRPSQGHLFYRSLGSVREHGCGDSVVQAVERYAKKVVEDTLALTFESAVFPGAEATESADRITYAEKLSPLSSQACRYCNLEELHECTGNSSQHFFRKDPVASSKPASNSKFNSIYQKSRIFHLDVPQIHVNPDKKTVLAEKIVAEAIEKAESELSNTSLAADSGIGQDGVSFADSLTAEVMTAAMMSVGHDGSVKERDDFPSAESLGDQQRTMPLGTGEDSTGSWSDLSFEDEQQDESSSFHHLSESDEPADKDEEHGADVEGLGHDGKALRITNVDMELCPVDPQLRLILQWLVASEAEVEELYVHDSAKKEFILLSERLQERGWKVGDVLQAVLRYYEGLEKAAPEQRCQPLFDWLVEAAEQASPQ